MMSLSRSMLPFVGILAAFLTLSACGDDEESVAEAGSRPIAQTVADLPKCEESMHGDVYPVALDGISFTCFLGKWVYERRDDKRLEKGSEYDPVSGILTDLRDGQTYRTVVIGDKVWTAENMRFRAYEYETAEVTPCYNFKESNCDIYGRLYSVGEWGQCPKGWHIPDTTEIKELFSAAAAGGERAETVLKSTEGWDNYDGESLNGTDELGFSLLPGGSLCRSAGFQDKGMGTRLIVSGSELLYITNPRMLYNVMMFRLNYSGLIRVDADCYGYVRCVKD